MFERDVENGLDNLGCSIFYTYNKITVHNFINEHNCEEEIYKINMYTSKK